MNKEELNKLIFETLGEVSAIFMSKKERGVDIVMPSTELEKLGNKLIDRIEWIFQKQLSSIYSEVEENKGWDNCIKGNITHGKCPACAERKGYNQAIDDSLTIIKSKME